MKKLFSIICTMLIAFGASAQQKSKTLVAYFSASGVTAKVAKQISEAAKADLYEITPKEKYSSADLNWRDKQSRSSVEMKDKSSRPEMAENISSVDQYETIYIGFPVWWDVAPHIINTFIEANKLEGKTIIPFATSGGSSIRNSVKDLRSTYPNLTIKDGQLLNYPTKSEIESFVK